MMSHSLCLSKHQLVKYIPTFAKATLKWATSWSTENQSSSKSQVPIWKSEQIQVANYFKNTQNIFMSLLDAPLRWCAAWIFKSEIQIWTSKPWSQTWDTQTECLKKKSWSVPLWSLRDRTFQRLQLDVSKIPAEPLLLQGWTGPQKKKWIQKKLL